MSTPVRTIATGLAAALAVAMVVAAPAAAAKQQIGPRVHVDGEKLPAPDEDTFGTAKDPAIGRTPPTLTGEGFKEELVAVGPTAEPRIVVFLAHWCPHCRAEVPLIVELAEEGVFEGIDVDTIATNTTKDLPNYPPSRWLKREDWPFTPVLADDARSRGLLAFGGTSFPYFVFVGSDGLVAGRWSGELEKADLTEIARRLGAGESLYGSS